MDGLLVKNIYGKFDCFRMDNGAFIQMATYGRSDVLREMSLGRGFYAFSRETTQYARLIPFFDAKTRSIYIRTDRQKTPQDSFFLDIDAPRLVPYEQNCVHPWATWALPYQSGDEDTSPSSGP